MSISFSNIPANWKTPFFVVEFNAVAQNQTLVNQQTLIIAQTVTVATATPTYIRSSADAINTFGAQSQLAHMVTSYKALDPNGTLYVLPLADDGSAAAAVGTIVVTGPATGNGVLQLYIGGFNVPVVVATSQTASTIASNINAAINGFVNPNGLKLPVTSSVNTATVTVTAVNKGVVGNQIDVRVNYRGLVNGEVLPSGITVVITALSGGSVNPSLAAVGTQMGDQNYDFTITPYTDSASTSALTTVMSNVSGRWMYSRQSYGHVFSAKRGTGSTYSAAISDLITLGTSLNDPHLTIMGYYDSPTSPWDVASQYGAAFAVSSKADPARPTQTLQLLGVLPPPPQSRWAAADMQTLLSDGIAIFNVVGSTCQIVRSVTTYQQNAFGQADQSYLDSETLFTLMAVIRNLKGAITNKYARTKLASNGTTFGPGANIVTPDVIQTELVAQYRTQIDLGLVENLQAFQAGLVVQRNIQDASRVDVLFDPILVSGLRIFAVLTQFALEVPSGS